MKQKLLLSLFALFMAMTSWADVEINATNFPDPKFRNWLLWKYGDMLTDVEIANTKEIYVVSEDIHNLKGIEFFSELEELQCSENLLAKLDLSRNTKLKFLDCSQNLLTQLNLSSCVALTKLHCYNNQLNGMRMDEFVESLPVVNAVKMYIIDNWYEQNEMTTVQVAAAKAKGWIPMYISCVDDKWIWLEYSGIDLDNDIAINSTNFPDENFRNYLRNQPYGRDGMLTKAEIADITDIDVDSPGSDEPQIRSLKGIEFFTALTSLSCEYNQITTIDLSNNVALEILWCDGNRLKTLNVSENTKLQLLSCEGNQMTKLDVSGCLDLEVLVCSENQLKSLDVSNNTKLTELYCDGNQLTALDVSQNTQLKLLTCHTNKIKGVAMDALVESLPIVSYGKLNVIIQGNDEQNRMTKPQVAAAKAKGWIPYFWNGNMWGEYDPFCIIDASNFPDANFRNWLLRQDYGADGFLTESEIESVTSIDVNGQSIQSLEGLEYFTSLTNLKCYSNKLTSLDVSKHTALTALSCGNNNLTSLDVSKNKKLTTLYCFNNSLGELDLSGCTSLNTLYCYQNHIKLAAMDALIESLPNTRGGKLRVIDDANERNAMTTAQVTATKAKGWIPLYNNGSSWQEYLGNDQMPEEIAIDALNFPDENFRNWLLKNSYGKDEVLTEAEIATITSIDVNGKSIQSLKGIEHFTALKTLQCHKNKLTELNLSENTELTMLYCHQNEIAGTAMDALVESLPTVSSGKMRVIYDKNEQNVMTIEQVEVAKAKGWIPQFLVNSVWKEYPGSEPVSGLAVDVTNFPDENFRGWVREQEFGADAVLTDEEIANVAVINVLDKGIKDLKGIENFTALKWLICGGNQLTALDVSENTELEYLWCFGNQLTELDVSKNTALTGLWCGVNQLTTLDVSQNTLLEKLDCSLNQLTELDLSKNAALVDLSCSRNQLVMLDVSGCPALASLWCYNNQLTVLNVSGCTALTTIFCFQNQILGTLMDELVEGMPTIDNGKIYVICGVDEQNVMTTEQVATVKAKGWTPICLDPNGGWAEYVNSAPDFNFEGSNWIEYVGNDLIPDGIRSIDNGQWTMDNEAVYNIAGQRIAGGNEQLKMDNGQLKPGIYIVNGKKILVR